MTIYSGPVFAMAKEQFSFVADHLDIPQDERARLLSVSMKLSPLKPARLSATMAKRVFAIQASAAPPMLGDRRPALDYRKPSAGGQE